MTTPHLILTCPSVSPAVSGLAARQPAVLAPFAGKSVLEYALTYFAAAGVREVTLVAGAAAAVLRSAVGRGESWGLAVTVVDQAPQTVPGEAVSWTLDRLPQLPEHRLWESYAGWFAAQVALLPQAARQAVGARELSPGVYVGLRSRVAADAVLRGPCWIGANVRIGAGAVVGPNAVVGEGSFVDEGAEVAGSVVAPQTYVGAHTELQAPRLPSPTFSSSATSPVPPVPPRSRPVRVPPRPARPNQIHGGPWKGERF